MSTQQQAYPLSWPMGWARTQGSQRQDAAFFSTSKRWISSPGSTNGGYNVTDKRKKSMSDACDFLYEELRRFGVAENTIVVSSNVERRLDGQPYANRAAPSDPGIAVYFRLKGQPRVLAADKWKRAEDNLYAIAKHIEAMRAQGRYGVGTSDQAFAGYTALPAPGTSGGATWYQVLGVAESATLEEARYAYIRLAKKAHPDNGGSHEAQVALNAAWDQARRAFGQ